MSPDTALAAALLCGAAGAAVPAVVRRLPQPECAAVAERPGLTRTAVLVSALAGAVVGLAIGWAWVLPSALVVVPVGVALALVDLHTRLLPKVLVLPLTGAVVVLLVLAAALDRDPGALLRAGAGLLAARGGYWLLWRARSSGLGFGDVRLAAPLGAVLGHLGWGQLALGLWSGFVVLGVPGLGLALVRRDRRLLRTAYPFGPAMLVGALVGVVAGAPVLDALIAR